MGGDSGGTLGWVPYVGASPKRRIGKADGAGAPYAFAKSKMLKQGLAHLEIGCVSGTERRCLVPRNAEDGPLLNLRLGGT